MADAEQSVPDWSDAHVSRANRFTLHVVAAWLLLTSLSVALAGTGTVGALFRGLLALGATWLLVHSLFSQVDGLVQTRLDEAGELAGGAGDSPADDGDAGDETSHGEGGEHDENSGHNDDENNEGGENNESDDGDDSDG
jgi:hypothetical protein